MLPTANEYFIRAGFSATAAAYMVIGLFVLGVVVIRIASAVIHSNLPSSIVECEPAHKKNHDDVERGDDDTARREEPPTGRQAGRGTTERTPLLQDAPPDEDDNDDEPPAWLVAAAHGETEQQPTEQQPHARPSISTRLSQQIRAVALQTKPACDETGRCLGFSHPCRPDCVGCSAFKSTADPCRPHNVAHAHNDQNQTAERLPPVPCSARAPPGAAGGVPLAHHYHYHHHHPGATSMPSPLSATQSSDAVVAGRGEFMPSGETTAAASPSSVDSHPQHHHHVPERKFMSLGLQTSLAIALHKLPEGFITFATNHTSPKLGWSVFVALFIHNITEGFAMCLPLYLALQSRLKAMIWSSFLGGISQPAGAAIAALWIFCARRGMIGPGDDASGSDGISWAVYGGLFAATSGVMTIVGLQLYSEGLHVSDNHPICVGFAIGGMGILGLSFALTAG